MTFLKKFKYLLVLIIFFHSVTINSLQAAKKKKKKSKVRVNTQVTENKLKQSDDKLTNEELKKEPPVKKSNQSIVLNKSQTLLYAGLSRLGTTENIFPLLEEYFEKNLETMGSFNVLKSEEYKVWKITKNNNLDCRGKEQCWKKAGKNLGAEFIVFGVITSVGDNNFLSLSLFDVKKKSVVKTFNEPISGTIDNIIPLLRFGAYTLVAPNQIKSSLNIETNEKEVQIYFNNSVIGVTPLKAPIRNLPPGKASLKLIKKGYKEEVIEIDLKPFDTLWVDVKLKK